MPNKKDRNFPDQRPAVRSILGGARDEVPRLRTSGGPAEPVTIYLRGGLYLLREPLDFTLEESGVVQRWF